MIYYDLPMWKNDLSAPRVLTPVAIIPSKLFGVGQVTLLSVPQVRVEKLCYPPDHLHMYL